MMPATMAITGTIHTSGRRLWRTGSGTARGRSSVLPAEGSGIGFYVPEQALIE
jgi:hypothetical protein